MTGASIGLRILRWTTPRNGELVVRASAEYAFVAALQVAKREDARTPSRNTVQQAELRQHDRQHRKYGDDEKGHERPQDNL